MKPKINIMMIGDGAVGKTSLLNRFDGRKFNSSHIRTTGLDSITVKKTMSDGREV